MFGKAEYSDPKTGMITNRQEYIPLLDRIHRVLEEKLGVSLKRDWWDDSWVIYQEIQGRIMIHKNPIGKFYEPSKSSNGQPFFFSYKLKKDLDQATRIAVDVIAEEKARELKKAQPKTWGKRV